MCGWILMCETTGDGLYYWKKRYYGSWFIFWINGFKLKHLNDGFGHVDDGWMFLTNAHILSSQDVNWWTGVVWITVMFLSDSHSDGTHSLQSIHCWDTDAMLHFSKSDEETKSCTSWTAWHFHQIIIFEWTIPLKYKMYIWKLDQTSWLLFI